MDREPAAVDGTGPGFARVRRSRRLLAAGLAIVLLGVIAVLAIRLAGAAPASSPAAAKPKPALTPAASLTVPDIYQRVAPSVVVIRTSHELGTGVIVADDGTILTANHVIAGGGTITVTFADGTTAQAVVATADPKLDTATLSPAKLPQVVVPATLGGGAEVGASVVAIGNPLGLTDSVSAGVISGLNRTPITGSSPGLSSSTRRSTRAAQEARCSTRTVSSSALSSRSRTPMARTRSPASDSRCPSAPCSAAPAGRTQGGDRRYDR
jgi:S1-C subfamily serine protease